MAEQKYLTVNKLNTVELARIFSKITVDQSSGCWLWSGWTSRYGYGKIKYFHRTEATHRLLWAWLVGPLPMGQSRDIPNLDHIVCDTKSCCFPGHLRLVLPRYNTLRSLKNPTAVNARRTHCAKGHELPLEPTRSEGRACPICRKEWHTSERYRKWNAEFGRAYHQAKRYGPEREAFLKRQRDNMRAWKASKKRTL